MLPIAGFAAVVRYGQNLDLRRTNAIKQIKREPIHKLPMDTSTIDNRSGVGTITGSSTCWTVIFNTVAAVPHLPTERRCSLQKSLFAEESGSALSHISQRFFVAAVNHVTTFSS